MSNKLKRLNRQMATLTADMQASLVQVHQGRNGQGAGTIWHAEGLVLTNAHVAGGRHGGLSVTLWDGRHMPARLLALDSSLDMAALSIEADDLPTIQPGDSRDLRPGDWVTAVGHPWGVKGAASAGVVIGVGRDLPEMPGGNHRALLAASLHLRPGHSGGPMVDAQGRLVGINTMIAGPQVGLAIPVHEVVRFLKETIGNHTRRPRSKESEAAPAMA